MKSTFRPSKHFYHRRGVLGMNVLIAHFYWEL